MENTMASNKLMLKQGRWGGSFFDVDVVKLEVFVAVSGIKWLVCYL